MKESMMCSKHVEIFFSHIKRSLKGFGGRAVEVKLTTVRMQQLSFAYGFEDKYILT